ncbi:serine protease [Mesorhizobium sp.]|uniref:S1 family peptidase n=1 Tax=Mesorhizobium sp. TaxID=1871066 RepID=UPI000FE85AE8|nr:serine protease [Mesorhizobium sp.]RWN27587.1 MAG: serine protease [Mesorhizobium sp.]
MMPARLLFTLSAIIAAAGLAVLLTPSRGGAQTVEQAHEVMRGKLVQLAATGQGTVGAATGTNVTAKGTGFLVSGDGYVLTSYHILEPIEAAQGVNLKIDATLLDGGDSRTLKATVVNASRLLDVLLLKVPRSAGKDFSFARIGESKNLTEGAEILTSGFNEDEYFTKPGTVSNRELNHWKLNLTVVGGYSGSPVYLRSGEVVGIVKGNLNADPSIGIMVPIELADPLTGGIRSAELRARLDWIIARLGEIPDGHQPIHTRLTDVELSLEDVSKHMNWEAHITRTLDVVVRYEKLVSGKPDVSSIEFAVTPFVRYRDGQIIRQKVMKTGKAARNGGAEGSGTGEFLIAGLTEPMKGKLVSEADSVSITGFSISVIPQLDNADGTTLDAELIDKNLEAEFKVDDH